MNLARPEGGGEGRRNKGEEQKIRTGKWKLRDRDCARGRLKILLFTRATIDPWIERSV